ncbi:hypothetical protein GCM10023238_19500 [Streptomyces heliomycini]
MVAQLYTQDGQKYGEPVTFDVKVTEITATVMLVIGGGVLLLVLAGFRMYTQRKRAAAREADGRDHEADEDTDDPQNPEAAGERPTRESGTDTGADDPSSRVTRHRTPHRRTPARPARVREWTVEMSWPVGPGR